MCLLLCLCCGPLHAAGWHELLSTGSSIQLGSQLPWRQWIDQDGHAGVEAVAARPDSDFQTLDGPVSEGYTRHVVWLRAVLPPEFQKEPPLWLQVSPPYLDSVTLYQLQQGQWVAQKAGDLMPGADRLATRKFLFRLHNDLPILLRVESSSVMRVYASVSRSADLLAQTERDGWTLGVYFGLTGALLLLVWICALVFRERRLAAIGILGTVTLFHAFNLHGYGNIWLFAHQPRLASDLVGLGAFAVAAALAWQTQAQLTRGRPDWRWIHRVLQGLLALNLAAMASVPLDCYGEFALIAIVSPMLVVFLATWVCGQELKRRGFSAEHGLLFLAYALHSGNSVLTLAEFTGTRVVQHDTALFWQFQLLLLLALAAAGVGAGLHQRFRQAHESRTRALQELAASERLLETRVEERTTELDLARQALQQALDQERRMRLEQRQFFSMISHEFRTPLTIIDSAATEQMSFPSERPDDQVERAAQIRRACRRLSALIDNSLCGERFNTASFELVPSPVDLAELVQEASQLVHWSPRHWLELELAPDVREWTADPTLLRIALSNLIDNAVKYARQGRVRVATRQDARGWLELSVSDQGPGLDAAARMRVFDKFERGLYNDTTRGFGLGLWITRRVARLHGGEVQVHSEPGQGCCFGIELPPHPAVPEGSGPSIAAAPLPLQA